MKRSIRLAIADNYKIFRDGICMAMQTREDVNMLWQATDGAGLIYNLLTQTPDVLLLDVKLPQIEVIKSINSIKKDYGQLKLIIMSMGDDMETIVQIMENGANAYLNKTADADEIYKAIITCYKDEFYFNDLVNEAVLLKLQQNKALKKLYPATAKFSDKELKILKLISEDKTTEEISDTIFLSPRTVETIRQNMKLKVGAKTVAGLLMFAIRNKLIQ